MNKKSVILISLNSVSCRDLNKLSHMKNFSQLISNAVLIKNVESIYTSLTYPAHATILTGRYPLEHGITNNISLQNGKNSPSWYSYRKYLKGYTLYDLAIKEGLTVASIFWPLTVGSGITYNILDVNINKLMAYLLGKNMFYRYSMNKRFGKEIKGLEQTIGDDFAIEVAKVTLKEKNPNLMLLYLSDVDYQKQYYGIDSKEVDEALIRIDKRIGDLVDELKNNYTYEETSIIVLSDHSEVNVNYAIRLNVLFRKEGLTSGINKGVILDNEKQINHGPTIAKILGLKLEDAFGILEEIIFENYN